MRRVALVGFAETWRDAPYDDPGVTIISLNEMWKYIPRWDEWMEIHDEESIGLTTRVGPGQVLEEVRAHRKWLEQAHDGKVIWMQERFCDGRFPAARPYPIDDIQRRFGSGGNWRYLTSTVAFMIALQVAIGRDDAGRVVDEDVAVEWLGLYGIELIGAKEYEHQRPCVEYFLGLARGLGIEVYVPEASALLKSDHIYGYERPPQEVGAITRARVEARLRQLRKHHDELVAQIHKVKGALAESENWLTVHEGARRGITKLPESFLNEL